LRAYHPTVENRPGLCLFPVLSSTFWAPDTERGTAGHAQRHQPARGDGQEGGDRAGVADTLRGLVSSPEAQVRHHEWVALIARSPILPDFVSEAFSAVFTPVAFPRLLRSRGQSSCQSLWPFLPLLSLKYSGHYSLDQNGTGGGCCGTLSQGLGFSLHYAGAWTSCCSAGGEGFCLGLEPASGPQSERIRLRIPWRDLLVSKHVPMHESRQGA
jgi:hypothetical protein